MNIIGIEEHQPALGSMRGASDNWPQEFKGEDGVIRG